MIDFVLFLTAVVGRVQVAGRVSGMAQDNITTNGTYDNVTQLINVMLKTYDIRLRPNFGERPVALDMDIAVASFDSVSEVNMDFTLTMYLYQYWKDERLAWIPNHRNESITLSGDFSQKIWVPDTFLANDKSSYLHDVTEVNKMLKLYSDGYIAYGMRFTSTLACKMDLRSFPLDRQNFSIEIESYGYTTEDLYMQWRNGRNSIRGLMDTEIPQFRILDFEAQNRLERTDTGTYQRLSLVLVLRRSVGYYLFQTYFPSTLIVALSWISFWINHEATAARVALGVTTVLTMTTISTGVRASLPRISYVKAIDIYLVMCFVFVFAALLEYAAVNYTYWGSTRMNKRTRRRQSDPAMQSMHEGRRNITANQAKEFPTWEMYVKNEEDVGDSVELCRHRRSNIGNERDDAGDEYEMQEHRGNDAIEEEEEADDVVAADFTRPDAVASDRGRSAPLRMTGQRSLTGRVSPIPGLLQQLRRQPIPEPCGASSSTRYLDERFEEANWTSLINASPDEFPRPPSSPVVSHTGSVVRRRVPPATIPYEQPFLSFEGDESVRVRRRTHPPQGLKRRGVTFSGWRNKSTNLAPASGRLQSRFQASFTRRELVSSLRRKARAVRAVLPRIHDVNVIDKWSRAMFPLSFVVFNVIYWCYYLFSDWHD